MRQPSSNGWGLSTADLSGIEPALVDDVEGLVVAIRRTLGTDAQGLRFRSHRFFPRGISLVGTSERIRLVLHTWPENGEATIDLYAPDGDGDVLLQRCVAALVNVRGGLERAESGGSSPLLHA